MVNETARCLDCEIGKYSMVKITFLEYVSNNNSIILFGAGRNGKTHLTNECSHLLNDYCIYQPEETYNWSQNTFQTTLMMDNTNEVMHFLFNPFEMWGIEQPENMKVIDMSEIHF